MPMAAKSATMWAPAFWSAIDQRLTMDAASTSMLPLPTSPATAPESAMTDQMPIMMGMKLSDRQLMKPDSVSMLMGSPSRPRNMAGSDAIC